MRVKYAGHLLAIPLIFAWFHSVYPQHLGPGMARAIAAVFGSCYAVVLFTDSLVFTRLLPLFQLLTLMVLPIAGYGVASMLWHRARGAWSVLIGIGALAVTVVHDLLSNTQMIADAGNWLSIGILCFLLSLMVNLIDQRATEKRRLEELSDALRLSNNTLEDRVQRRTIELDKKARDLAEANTKLTELAERDGLTRLYNRRTVIDRCQALADAGHEAALLIVDADHFKAINDRFGHAAGDEVLAAIARLLRGAEQLDGVVGRLGGEEFLVILPGADRSRTTAYCKALLRQARAMRLDRWPELGPVTLSIGVAWDALGDEAVETALERADEAMYRAKREGRDRYVAIDRGEDPSISSSARA